MVVRRKLGLSFFGNGKIKQNSSFYFSSFVVSSERGFDKVDQRSLLSIYAGDYLKYAKTSLAFVWTRRRIISRSRWTPRRRRRVVGKFVRWKELQGRPYFVLKRPLKFLGRYSYASSILRFWTRTLRLIVGLGFFRSELITAKHGLSVHFNWNLIISPRLEFVLIKVLSDFILRNFLIRIRSRRFCLDRIRLKARVNKFYGVHLLRRLPVRGQRTKTNSRSARSFFRKLNLIVKI
jgi:ribosomal protein S13